MTWPTTELRAAADADGNDVLLLVGAEPDHHWPSFVRSVCDLVVDLGAHMALGLGAYPAAVPHTRPSRLSVASSSPELSRRATFVRASIDAPAGVQAAIEMPAREGRAILSALRAAFQAVRDLRADNRARQGRGDDEDALFI